MWDRRQFLVGGAAASLALAHGNRAFSAPEPKRAEGEADKRIAPETRKALEAGLKFLGEGQNKDGGFGRGGYEGNVGITSLAGLAFVAAGHEADAGARGKIVGKTLDFVLSQENRGGGHPGYLHNPDASPHGPMYSHGFATLLLAFLRGKVKDKKQAAQREEVLGRAVELIVSSQNKEGGWRYTPDIKDADVSVTTCQMMALAAARQFGLTVPEKTTAAGVGYIKKCFAPALGAFQYMAGGRGASGFARTAAAVAALQAMGIHKGEEVEKGLAYMIRTKPAAAPRPDMHYYYGLYYATRVLHGRGGAAWDDWYKTLCKQLVGQQGEDGGWKDQIDPHYATAMACLVLLTPEGRLVVGPKPKKNGG